MLFHRTLCERHPRPASFKARLDYAHCVDYKENNPMLLEWDAEQEAALRKMVEVQRKHDFLSTDMRQSVQQWMDLN